MKTFVLLLLSIFFFNFLYGQEKAIKIQHAQTGEERYIFENKRIRVKSFGKKISGRFKILDDQTILIKDQEIKLESIEKIKRNPLGANIAIDFVLASIGGYFFIVGVAVGVVIAVGLNSPAAGAFIGAAIAAPGVFLIFGAIKSPNLFYGYRMTKWNYSIEKIAPQ